MSVRVNICGYYSQVSIHKLNLLLKNHAGIPAISNRMARIRTTKIVEKGKKKISNTQDRKGAISIVVDLSWTASAWWILTQLYIFAMLPLRKKNMFLRHKDFFWGWGVGLLHTNNGFAASGLVGRFLSSVFSMFSFVLYKVFWFQYQVSKKYTVNSTSSKYITSQIVFHHKVK